MAQPDTNGKRKWVYSFVPGKAEGGAGMSELLGGKGANLAEMARLGLPVPPGFTITTDVCESFFAAGNKLPDALRTDVMQALDAIGETVSGRFGDEQRPLLVSVRSGSRASMPGMMDTILNLGLNDKTVEGLAALTGDPRFAFDSYRRFIQMYGDVVLGVNHGAFEDILENFKNLNGFAADTDLDEEAWREIIADYKAAIEREYGAPFPQDTSEQLWGAIAAVFNSWYNPRAETYRRLHDIPDNWGTAVTVQAMVFGNLGDNSATGVAFTRNPSTGENEIFGEYLPNAQGEDVVAGIRTPQPLTKKSAGDAPEASLEVAMPEAFAELKQIFHRLEHHYRDMQDVEFTVQLGKLWILQTRPGKRTTDAALRIAIDLAAEGLITQDEAILRVRADAARSAAASRDRSCRRARPDCQGIARFAGSRVGRNRIPFRDGGGTEGQRQGRHSRPLRNEPRGCARHAFGCRHPNCTRRHDESRGRRGARHGPAMRLGCRNA